MKYRD